MKRFILGAATRELAVRLKKRFVILATAVLVVTVMAPAANAAFTPISPSPGEPNLIGTGGILDSLYGLSNLERIMDSFIGDQLWGLTSSGATAMVVAKFSGFDQTFGVIPGASGGAFIPVFTASGTISPTLAGPSFPLPALTGSFRFSDDPSGAPLWSSRESDNSGGGLDHMVTWKILGTQSFVVGWEDLNLGDQDYNDLVVQVNGTAPVPEPGTLLLLGTGFVGMGTIVRRRNRRK